MRIAQRDDQQMTKSPCMNKWLDLVDKKVASLERLEIGVVKSDLS
jgi:hypothetical protein